MGSVKMKKAGSDRKCKSVFREFLEDPQKSVSLNRSGNRRARFCLEFFKITVYLSVYGNYSRERNI